jgi:hypothetical protein
LNGQKHLVSVYLPSIFNPNSHHDLEDFRIFRIDLPMLSQPPTPNSALPTPNSALPTPNSQLPTPNRNSKDLRQST